MKRVGFLLKVKADKLEEYKQHHAAVWPEMLEALRRTGWHNYSIFAREDGLLFGYFETPECFEAALEGMSKEEINRKWQDTVAPFFEEMRVAGAMQTRRREKSGSGSGTEVAYADESMLELEEVFHLD